MTAFVPVHILAPGEKTICLTTSIRLSVSAAILSDLTVISGWAESIGITAYKGGS